MRDDGAGRRRLVVTADDLGLSPLWDEAIVRACDHGVVTSTSVATTGRSYPNAARKLRATGVDHGIHLDLLDGAPASLATEIPSLVDRTGRFRPLGELLLRFVAGRVSTDEVEHEWGQQIERGLADGLQPSHLNGHYHLHVLPGVFRLALRLAARFGIGWIRMPDEPPWHVVASHGGSGRRRAKTAALWLLSRAQRHAAKGGAVRPVDCRSAGPSARSWERTLQGIHGERTEIFCHPGQSDEEMAALLSPALRGAIDGRFRRISFRELAAAS